MLTDAEQQEFLEKFRSDLVAEDLLHDGDTIGTDDETLLRFLRARKFDVQQSKLMFQNCQNWRKTVQGVGIDELYRTIDPFDFPNREAIFECWPMWFHKTDKKGRPINVQFFGGMNINKLYLTVSPEEHWRWFIVSAESLTREVLPACDRAAGKPVGGDFVIIDLNGFSFTQFWQIKSLVRDAFQISQDYYPEGMSQLILVNAPSSFTMIWGVVKRWLAKETIDKIEILGSDYVDVLLEHVDAENLPTSLGGKCTCAEYGGCSLSGLGPWKEGRVGWGPQAQAQRDAEKADSVQDAVLPQKLEHDQLQVETKIVEVVA